MDQCSFIFTIVLSSFIVFAHGKPYPESLSRQDTEHFIDDPDRHVLEFDHNAFLGKEQAKSFSKLSPLESEEKLRTIVHQIDKDNDHIITEPELKDWITYMAKLNIEYNVNRQWLEANPTKNDKIVWKEYINYIYGPEEERLKDVSTLETYENALRQDKRRWKSADVDKDGHLSKAEFSDFIHPEEKIHMRDAIIDELLETVDHDKDGYVSETEYLNDLSRAYQTAIEPNKLEPYWVERERGQFHQHRDKNKDGRMDRDEVGEWIMPTNYDPIEAETKHLIYHADENQDGQLTEEEIVNKRDIFISSQATNYGDVLKDFKEL